MSPRCIFPFPYICSKPNDMRIVLFILLFLSISACQQTQPDKAPPPTDGAPSTNNSQQTTKDPLGDSQQLLRVTAKTDTSTTATLQRYEKINGDWQPIGSTIPVNLGRTGLAWGTGLHDPQPGQQKAEGDGKAPAGIFRLTAIYGYAPADSVNFKMPYIHASETLECVDDSNSKYYNQLVDNQQVEKDWNSSEMMRRKDDLYKWGVLVEHNGAHQPKGGSCIFLHIWRGPGKPTAGCTAMEEGDMEVLLEWLEAGKRPLMVQSVLKAPLLPF